MKISKALTGTALALGLFANAAQARELKFANFMPPANPYQAGAFEPFAEKLAAATNNEITVHIYAGGELGPGPVEQFSRAVDGVADFAVGLPGYTASQFPVTLLTELPGVIDEETGTEVIWKNINLFKPEFKRAVLVSLWSNAENVLYTREKPVRTPDDVKGLKIRVPSRNAGLLVEAWGATPVSMPVPEIYNALQTGVIDGALIDGTGTKAFKLGEVSKYLTVGFDTTISPFFIVMNRDSFASLTDEQKAAVEEIGKEISVTANAVQLAAAHKGIDAFAEMDGKQVIRLSDDEATAFNALADEARAKAIEEATASGIAAGDVVSALQAQ
ncbi:C4-dicarboxylate-binding periplasmic protein precursor [Labrenzia sp. THAF35]|uniref:TRAP transporter substrate-binding protein n=1 Tax=Labrenzia sp. THAF35 TaxID=2587854 RepID=UPI00126927AA|nr:TRAP transporter substrate-binding protein [Labrenzia sp. THAF35]QFT67888.1 C4-dicarboxylate-binding periplasmic protein precursor [Labrenzia sp. THAF35]